MGARENECQISQNYILHMKFSEFYLSFHNSWEIWQSFSRTPMRNFLWCYYKWLIKSLALEKCKKRMQYSLNYSGTKFLSPKIKITEFSGEFLLNAWNFMSGSMMNDHTRSPIDFCFRGILRGASYSCSPEWHSEHPAGWFCMLWQQSPKF